MPRNRTDKPHATSYNGYEKVKRNKSKKIWILIINELILQKL